MTDSFTRRVTFSATAAVMAALALVASAARAVPSVPHSFSYTAAIPTGYVGTAETADLTHFDAVILLPQISSADGAQLTSITITLSGGVFGDFSATNSTSNRSYRDRTADISAAITVASPDPSATPLGVVLPLVSRSFDLAPRQTVGEDDLLGFATSTRTTDASDPDFDAFAPLFLGTGTVALPVSAVGTSRFSGSGNVRFAANTPAGATATIRIDWLTEAAVAPDPAGAGGVSRSPSRRAWPCSAPGCSSRSRRAASGLEQGASPPTGRTP